MGALLAGLGNMAASSVMNDAQKDFGTSSPLSQLYPMMKGGSLQPMQGSDLHNALAETSQSLFPFSPQGWGLPSAPSAFPTPFSLVMS